MERLCVCGAISSFFLSIFCGFMLLSYVSASSSSPSYLFCIIILCKCVSSLGLLWLQGIPPGSWPCCPCGEPTRKVLVGFLSSQFGSPRFGSLGPGRHCFPHGNLPGLMTPGSAPCLASRDSCCDASISLDHHRRHRPELVVFQTVTREGEGRHGVSICH